MDHPERTAAALRMGVAGAIATLAGIILSGPVAVGLLTALGQSRPWQGAADFAQHYSPIQTAPYFAGFALVLGYVVLIAALYQLAEERDKSRCLVAVMLASVFCALIFFNYINQTTFVPALARAYSPEYDGVIAAFSFANPRSLCWAIEMWGYAFLAVALWFAAPVFSKDRLGRVIRGLIIANAVISIAGGFITAWDLAWVMTLPAGVNYVAWNVLVFALSACVLVSLRRRQRPETIQPA
jgi:hypothetical protein